MRYRRYITNRYKRYIYPAIIKELQEMGAKGEKVIQENYTKEIVTRKYVDLIESL